MAHVSDILTRIIADKRREVSAARAARSLDEVKSAARSTPAPRDFHSALAQDGIRVIAECKRQSPSRGVMIQNYDPVRLAKAYAAGGAAAISVLTDGPYFGGSLEHLVAVKAAVGVPVLRKDFVIDEYQIHEARAAGADTYLLLAGVLPETELRHLLRVGRELGMEALVESHTEEDLAVAKASGGKILGINNRNLKTFSVDLGTARALQARIMQGDSSRIPVCESGIKNRTDVEVMAGVGYKVFLIGEALATHPDPQSALQDLLNAGT